MYWTLKNKLIINPNKCEFIYINPCYQKSCIPHLELIPPKFGFHTRHGFKQIPEVQSMRYLGIFINNKFQYQKTQILQSAKKKFSFLLTLIIDNHLPLTSITIINLFNALVRSTYEYGILFNAMDYWNFKKSAYSNIHLIKKLQLIQNKILRLTFHARKSTPIRQLQWLANQLSVQERYEFFCYQHYTKFCFAPHNHPLHFTKQIYQTHLKYLNGFPSSTIQQTIYHTTKFISTIRNLPITKYAHSIMDDELTQPNFPILTIPHHTSSHKIYYNLNDIKNPIHNTQHTQIFTDGSNLQNPGPAGIGYYSLPNNLHDEIKFKRKIPYPCEINETELLGLYFTLKGILTKPNQNNYIYIYIDNINVIKWISVHQRIKNLIYYKKCCQIHEIINKIFKKYPNVKLITIQKIKGHQNIYHNIADNLAGQAARQAQTQPLLPRCAYHLSKAEIKPTILQHRLFTWNHYTTSHHSIKPFLPTPSNYTFKILNLIPNKMKRFIIGLITLHSGLNFYLSKFSL